MSTIYQGKSGKTYTIEEPMLASGGEGSIYAIQGYNELVLKVFKPDRRTNIREEKLLKMAEYQLNTEQLKQIVWPRDVVYDQSGFVGYVMPRLLENRNLNVVYSTAGIKLDLRHKMLIAYNLCAAIDTVHSFGQVCGDLNPQNICVDLNLTSESALRVTLVDTDSYHITNGEKTYRCEVGLANYIAPEIQKKMAKGQDLRSAPLPTYTKETDLFALAVHIFALLMNGCHPFACAKKTDTGYENTMKAMDDTDYDSIVLPQPIENIKDGFFPFHQERTGITYPLYAPNFKSLPNELQRLFIRAFENGYFEPKERPTTQEWIVALKNYQSSVSFQQCEKKHYYLKENSMNCPYCEAQNRMRRMMSRDNFDIPNANGQTKNSQSSDGTQHATGTKYTTGIHGADGTQNSNNTSRTTAKNNQQTFQSGSGLGYSSTNHTSAMDSPIKAEENMKKLQKLKLYTLVQLIACCIVSFSVTYGFLIVVLLEVSAVVPIIIGVSAAGSIAIVIQIKKNKMRQLVYEQYSTKLLIIEIINCVLGGMVEFLFLSIVMSLGPRIVLCTIYDAVMIGITIRKYSKLKQMEKSGVQKNAFSVQTGVLKQHKILRTMLVTTLLAFSIWCLVFYVCVCVGL